MTREQFNKIANSWLKMYKDCVTEYTYDSWYESLKQHDYKDVYAAVKAYTNDPSQASFTPKPGNIIAMLPKAPNTGKSVKRYEIIDGVEKRVIACKQCLDTGLVMHVDKEGRTVGHPCTCSTAHEKYKWGWLTREQQEAFVAKNGHHGEIIGEVWPA